MIKYLGSKGSLKGLMSMLKDIPKEQKPEFGQRANALRQQVQQAVQRLPREQAEVIVLKIWEGFTFAEVKELTDINDEP